MVPPKMLECHHTRFWALRSLRRLKCYFNFDAERTHVWPAGSLEDVVSNLVKNWEKEASYKIRLEDWRTINHKTYRFSCNGGRGYTADEMMEIGTYNALIQVRIYLQTKLLLAIAEGIEVLLLKACIPLTSPQFCKYKQGAFNEI